MTRRIALSATTGLSLFLTAPAPASVKPCRDRAGRVVECPKVRKVSPRCKDASGKFAPCPPAPTPGTGHEGPPPPKR